MTNIKVLELNVTDAVLSVNGGKFIISSSATVTNGGTIMNNGTINNHYYYDYSAMINNYSTFTGIAPITS
ncbi:hypothetical protein D3C84_1225660 [compost metagenome]